jgi:tight adherence protein B
VTVWLAAAAAGAALAVWRGRSPERRLTPAAPPEERSRRLVINLVTAALALLAGSAARIPMPAVAVAGAVAFGGWRWWGNRERARERDRCAAAVVEITFALAGELRAGRTPVQAINAAVAMAGPLADRLRMVQAAVAAGGSAADELESAATLPGAERMRYVAAAWRVTEGAGGRIARVLEKLGEAMDGDEQLRRELDAALAGPRATMGLLTVLPAFGILLGQVMGARPVQLLVHRPIGWGLLAAATALDAVGVWGIRRITRAALRC